LKLRGGEQDIFSRKGRESTMPGSTNRRAVHIPESERVFVGLSVEGHLTFKTPKRSPPKSVEMFSEVGG
jgi:hypothetical protein